MVAVAFVFGGVVIVLFAVLLLVGRGGDDGGGDDGEATLVPGEAFVPSNEGEERLVELARRSVESIPNGTWPDLYQEFTPDFQARCTPEDFAQAGVDSAQGLGDDLALLGFVHLQGVLITGDTAVGTIQGEVRGKSDYQIQASYEREDGIWKLAPAPGTAGCEAFNRITQEG
jgi:hypothetical protein